MNFADVEVVGACDIVPGKARKFLDRYELTKIPAFDHVKDLVKDKAIA